MCLSRTSKRWNFLNFHFQQAGKNIPLENLQMVDVSHCPSNFLHNKKVINEYSFISSFLVNDSWYTHKYIFYKNKENGILWKIKIYWVCRNISFLNIGSVSKMQFPFWINQRKNSILSSKINHDLGVMTFLVFSKPECIAI